MRLMSNLTNKLLSIVLLLLLLVAAAVGYRLARVQVAAEVYRTRLAELAGNYEQLRSTYNEAVRKTAVTELLVEDNTVCVRIRNAQGIAKTIPTPYDASKEIYIDYIVLDGRLWIRRVFDQQTSPEQGIVIDPELAQVNWDNPAARQGKAAYRRLTEGRWIVTVTGDGSLGLAKATTDTPAELTPPPAVRDYPQILEQADAEIRDISATEVLRKLVGG